MDHLIYLVGHVLAVGHEVSCHLGGSVSWMAHQIYGPRFFSGSLFGRLTACALAQLSDSFFELQHEPSNFLVGLVVIYGFGLFDR